MIKGLVLSVLLFLGFSGMGQENSSTAEPNVAVKWAPTGLLLGSASLQAEYNFGGRNSLTAKIGLPVSATGRLTYEDEKARFTMKATSFLAGYRTYFSRKKHLRGLYYEPFFKYVYHVSEGTGNGTVVNRRAVFDLTNTYSGFGLGLQLGTQFFIGKKIVVDIFFLGPEINAATNSFKAAEVGNNYPWTALEAKHVEDDLRTFLKQFPLIRDRMTLMVDKEMKRVNAHFKGALPGIRTGFSVGFAF